MTPKGASFTQKHPITYAVCNICFKAWHLPHDDDYRSYKEISKEKFGNLPKEYLLKIEEWLLIKKLNIDWKIMNEDQYLRNKIISTIQRRNNNSYLGNKKELISYLKQCPDLKYHSDKVLSKLIHPLVVQGYLEYKFKPQRGFYSNESQSISSWIV
jgi:hypothetical protein